MRLIPHALVVDAGSDRSVLAIDPSSLTGVVTSAGSGLTVDVGLDDAGRRITWTLRNPGDAAIRVRSVALVYRVTDVVGPLRFFRNGYQSWTPTGVAVFGVDEDPSVRANFEFLQAVHHADQRTAEPGELRSEWFTALDDDSADGPIVAGFDAGTSHDGTFRLRPGSVLGDLGGEAGGRGGDADAAVDPHVWVEAFLGDAELPGGGERPLHAVSIRGGDGAGSAVGALLDEWATTTGRDSGARTSAPFQLGWCSWYHYFHDVTEAHIRANLEIAATDGWPFDVFQVDDGYQSAIGDWLTTNAKFPSGLGALAEAISSAGFRPGLWYAPFLAAPDSVLATEHPDWLARHVGSDGSEEPLVCWWNPPWEGGRQGLMYGLDTSNPEVIAHLESVAAALVAFGYTYLKLDFTFAPTFDGIWHDPTRTPAERLRAGYAAVRAGAGDDTFILGCGVPLAAVVGLVDGNRIGQDVAPLWSLPPTAEIVPGYLGIQPATQHAYGNTLTRSFLHRRFWLNDPDCLMLRTAETELDAEAAHTWARAVGLSGGMALVSDDLALLDDDARRLLDEAVSLGRAADELAAAGTVPEIPDLLGALLPTTIRSAGHTLVTDPATGRSTFT